VVGSDHAAEAGVVEETPHDLREIPMIAARMRRTVALAGVTLLIELLSAVLPPACRLPSSALADPGNGKGGEAHGNSNDHDHENNGNGPDGNSGKGNDEDDAAKSDIGRFGLVVLDEQQLASLDLTITRVRVPRRMTAPAARTLLATQYPGVLVDLNAIYRQQAACFWSRPSRRAI
jgi:hypothetical protein